MARSEKSAGGGTASDSTVQTGIEESSLAFGGEGDCVVRRAGPQPSASNVQQARLILEQIACMASQLRELGHLIVNCEPEDLALHGATAANLASQVGWLADLGARKLGGNVVLGDPEAWMLPPVYHNLQAEAEGGGHA